MSYYGLRQLRSGTVADATLDPNAIRVVMGHVDNAIDSTYTHGISDDRVRAVCEHVRRWLFGPAPGTDGTSESDRMREGEVVSV